MKITDLLQHLDDACGTTLNKKAYLEVALAVELAFSVQLPSQPVNNLVEFFENTAKERVYEVIGEVNEMYPISVTSTYSMVVDYYRARYTLCHEPMLLSANDLQCLVSRPQVEASLTQPQKDALQSPCLAKGRADLRAFVGRYILPVQSA